MRLYAANAGSTVSWQCLDSRGSKLVLNCLRFLYTQLSKRSCLKPAQCGMLHSLTSQVHMLLLAHLAREDIPAVLQRDLQFLLTKGLPMLQEMLGLATAPRVKVGAGMYVCGPRLKEASNVGERTFQGRCETVAKQCIQQECCLLVWCSDAGQAKLTLMPLYLLPQPGYGWLAPTVGCIEMMQCMVQVRWAPA